MTKKTQALTPQSDFQGLTVLIPFRNEELNLPRLLQDFEASENIPEHLELIFINDHSTDDSLQNLENWKTEITYKVIDSIGEGKKAAIASGAKNSSFVTLLSIDADVRLRPDWLNAVYHQAASMVADMVILPVIPSKPKGFVSRFANLDYFALLGTTFGSAAHMKPVMASGANLIFNKFLLSDTASDIASGDDMFLLHYAKSQSKGISYTIDPRCGVHVDMPRSFNQFWSQRVRWTAKSASYTDRDTLLVSWVVFLFNTVLLLSIVPALMQNLGFILVPIFGLKIFLDLLLLWNVLGYFKRREELWFFPIASLIYPLYIPLVVFSSRFSSFAWKGRQHDQ